MKKRIKFISILILCICFLPTILYSQINPLLDSNLRDIFFIDEDYGWVVGSNGVIIRTTNAGENWIGNNTPYNEYYASVFFVSRYLGWTITTYNNRVYLTTDGGHTWGLIATLNDPNIYLQDIFFINDSTGFICGSDQVIQKTTDYGYNWQEISGSFYGSSVIEFVNENYAWIGAFNSVKKTTNGGGSWVSIDLLTYAFFVTEISLLDQNNGFLIGYGWDNLGTDYNIFISTNTGGSNLYYKTFYTPLWDIHFNTTSDGWIAGPTMYKTVDGGQNWITLNPALKKFVFKGNKSWGINFNNEIMFSDDGFETATMQFSFTVGVENETSGFKFELSQNYPNPFNPITKIKFQIPDQVRNDSRLVTLKVYDVLGNEIATLVNEEKQPGTYEVEFNSHSGEGRNLPSGVYFYQLRIGGPETSSGQKNIQTKKMVILK
jgi:photosystem II stability/assembly factor-like uncharacterized protein